MAGPSRHAGYARGGHDDHVPDGRERRKEREYVDNRREEGRESRNGRGGKEERVVREVSSSGNNHQNGGEAES